MKVGTQQHTIAKQGQIKDGALVHLLFHNRNILCMSVPSFISELRMPGGLAFMKYVKDFRTRGVMKALYKRLPLKMYRSTNVNTIQIVLAA